MSLISELEYERNRYYKLMDNIKSICSHLNTSTTNIESATNQLGKYYRIDSDIADNSKLKDSVDSINNIYNILITKIIPTINSRIAQLNIEITRLHELDLNADKI